MEKCGPIQDFRVRGHNFASTVLDRTRIYVIGDIHGRSDLLDRMVDHISCDLDASPISDCMTVTLGDYIDRGPDSRGVLDRLVRNPFPTELRRAERKSRSVAPDVSRRSRGRCD